MDEVVLQGMAKWPNVPAVFGWLALDRRGNWLLKGERIGNAIVTAFINRNYERDAQGRWFFQNGPQRVFVDLACTPLVFRVVAPAAKEVGPGFESHTGQRPGRIDAVYVDETGNLILDTDLGAGVVDDRDAAMLPALLVDAEGRALDDEALLAALAAPEDARLRLRLGDALYPVHALRSAEVAARCGFVARPLPPPGVEACY